MHPACEYPREKRLVDLQPRGQVPLRLAPQGEDGLHRAALSRCA